VQLRTRSIEVADDCGHASLVAHGSRQVDGLLGVILREAAICEPTVELSAALYLPLDLTPVAGSALSRQEGQ
jgi:hypothetical protein